MAHIKLHTTPEFEADLATLMRARGLRSKPQAIRLAVHETAAASRRRNLQALIGLVDRLPGGRKTKCRGEDLLAEIDTEMETAIDRLVHCRRKPL
jgi:hypothetical protein